MLSSAFLTIPTTTAPYQQIVTTLANQNCIINLYTKSINVPMQDPGEIPTDPPRYQNINPVFIDLFAGGSLIIGGVIVKNNTLIVRDTYFGFAGDLAVTDTSGANQDPYGVSLRLPPPDLRNWWQRNIPLAFGGKTPPSVAGSIPGMGTRFLLNYWPAGTYTPGYPA
jgi:hypothetical protein